MLRIYFMPLTIIGYGVRAMVFNAINVQGVFENPYNNS
jgi:hypothetical protein